MQTGHVAHLAGDDKHIQEF